MSADLPRTLHALYSPHQMRLILQRERLRADRNDGRMSVVVFELPRGTRWRYRRLARLVLKRCRATDEIGWMSKCQVGAVLPETAGAGAYCFADGVRRSAAGRGLDATFTLYSYPDAGSDSRGHEAPAREAAGALRGRRSVAAAGVGQRVARVIRSAVGPFRLPPPRGADAPAGAPPQVLPMQMLLREPVPAWKRAMDVLGAAAGLAVAAPVMAVSALLIRASSPGPVIFRQVRTGQGGARFTILKFRTMVPDAEKLKQALRARSEQDGPAFKMKNDPRVTLIGRFLRATSLDELPQLWNVLVGNMSLVGPRPLPVEEADGCRCWHRRRLDVMPGLTCIWQVRGRSQVKFDDWMRMDMEYIHNRSFLQDLKILLLTVPAVVLRRGAH